MSSPSRRHRAGAGLDLMAILAVTSALAAPGVQAATGGAASTSTPTFPVPASAKVPPTSTATTPTTPATGGTAVAPTTTYTPPSTPPAGSVPTTTTASPATPSGSAPATTTAPASAHASRSSKLSTPAIALATLGGLLALLCLAWAIARARAYEPHWVRSLRHSLAEGGFRASATWAEFSDWARLGK